MNKKGFTLVELLAVIVILGLLVTIAVAAVSRYRNKVNEKEITALNSTIIGSYQNYRVKNYVSENTKIDINMLSFTNTLNYNNEECSDTTGSSIKHIIRGNVDGSTSKEEIFCIKLTCNGKVIINDYETNGYCIN